MEARARLASAQAVREGDGAGLLAWDEAQRCASWGAADLAVSRDALRPDGESGVGLSIFLARVRHPPTPVPHRPPRWPLTWRCVRVCAHRGSGASVWRRPRGE